MDSISIAKFLAVPSGFILGSYNGVFSQNVIPHLYGQPASVSTPIFARIFNIGAATIFPVAVMAVGSYAYLAYSSRPAERKIYATCAVLMLATLPFTGLVMSGGINRLIEISKDTSLLSKPGVNEEATRLLKTWVIQNSFRASLNLSAGLLGMYAILS